MDKYITGGTIRRLREARGLTQEELAGRIHVSGKAVSKWETGQGLPDISLLEPLAAALAVSVQELLSGAEIRNRNRHFNMQRLCFYVCPVCGNIVQSAGEALVSCCGITLPPLSPEAAGGEHEISVQPVEDELFVFVEHPMEKTHCISFLAAVTDRGVQLVKLYPEGPAEARFKRSRVRWLYAYCSRDGLFRVKI